MVHYIHTSKVFLNLCVYVCVYIFDIKRISRNQRRPFMNEMIGSNEKIPAHYRLQAHTIIAFRFTDEFIQSILFIYVILVCVPHDVITVPKYLFRKIIVYSVWIIHINFHSKPKWPINNIAVNERCLYCHLRLRRISSILENAVN